jgi:segregation and condensation protein A
MSFRVQLDVFRGPLDLLLYLVRKHEVEITEVSVAALAQQFLEYLDLLRELDLNVAGDFVETASLLTEMKSRMVLPRGGEEEEPADEPPHDLVRQLLEYKRYRDAASMLEERGRAWQERYPRLVNDVPPTADDPADEPIQQVELWDLVQALAELVRENQPVPGPSIVYDETPIHVYMSRIQDKVRHRGRVMFHDLFDGGMRKPQMVSVFLAVLELMRHRIIIARQEEPFGQICLVATDAAQRPIDPETVDNYDHERNISPSP